MMLPPVPAYETRWFPQPLDHFGPTGGATWAHRYLFADEHWGSAGPLANGCKGPILFYTGNEGPIDAFWGSNGFMQQVLAPRLGALLVFAEERYYGLSRPQNASGKFDYLSTEQVLGDYAALITWLKSSLSARSCPVISFGGSYGGTLTTLFRVKYPHVVAGGLASSAPLGYYAPHGWAARGVTPTTWFGTVVRVYTEAGCYDKLVAAVRSAGAVARSPGGPQRVASTFRLCSPPADVGAWVYWLTEALESIPQVDYPQPSGALPANPVAAACDAFGAAAASNETALLEALAEVVTWYYGPYGADGKGCARHAASVQVGGGVPGDGPQGGPQGGDPWGYQSCTETLHNFSTSAGSWRQYAFDLGAISALCQDYYGVTPDVYRLERWAGGYAIADLRLSSNIIWSNGRRDPWHGGGFLRPDDALPGGAVYVMEKTAHHQDLRAPCAADPPELTAVRVAEEALIRKWIHDASVLRGPGDQ